MVEKKVLNGLGHFVSPTYKLSTFWDFFFFKCRRENILGGTELPVTPAIASNYERLPATFGDDRTFLRNFHRFRLNIGGEQRRIRR